MEVSPRPHSSWLRGRPLGEHRSMKLEDEPMLYIVDPAIEEGILRKKKS